MKTISLFLFVFLSSNVFAGQIVYQNLYGQHTLVQGQGKSKAAAESDAIKFIPKGYQKDPNNSPTVNCLNSKLLETGVCSEKSDLVLFTIPVVSAAK